MPDIKRINSTDVKVNKLIKSSASIYKSNWLYENKV